MTQTQNVETRIYKDWSKQWNAQTYIPLAAPNRFLKVSTSKSNRGVLTTYCHAVKRANGVETMVLFGDYSANVKSFPEVKIVNEKRITQCHEEAMKVIQIYIEAANKFYERKLPQAIKEAI